MPPVRLLVGRSAVIDVGTPISRVALTSADVADAMVTGGNQLLINGQTPGTITMKQMASASTPTSGRHQPCRPPRWMR